MNIKNILLIAIAAFSIFFYLYYLQISFYLLIVFIAGFCLFSFFLFIFVKNSRMPIFLFSFLAILLFANFYLQNSFFYYPKENIKIKIVSETENSWIAKANFFNNFIIYKNDHLPKNIHLNDEYIVNLKSVESIKFSRFFTYQNYCLSKNILYKATVNNWIYLKNNESVTEKFNLEKYFRKDELNYIAWNITGTDNKPFIQKIASLDLIQYFVLCSLHFKIKNSTSKKQLTVIYLLFFYLLFFKFSIVIFKQLYCLLLNKFLKNKNLNLSFLYLWLIFRPFCLLSISLWFIYLCEIIFLFCEKFALSSSKSCFTCLLITFPTYIYLNQKFSLLIFFIAWIYFYIYWYVFISCLFISLFSLASNFYYLENILNHSLNDISNFLVAFSFSYSLQISEWFLILLTFLFVLIFYLWNKYSYLLKNKIIKKVNKFII